MSAGRDVIRVLVADDEPAVREAFGRTLAAPAPGPAGLEAMEARIFGTSAATTCPPFGFDVVFAAQGREALAHVGRAAADGSPIAVAFVDVRMPPGWDGIETIRRIWMEDPSVQVVVCTAYSDRPWDEIATRLGRTDGLLLLKKPYEPAEVRQAAAALGEKWRLARLAARELDASKRLAARLEATNDSLRVEIAERQAAEERLLRHAYYDALTGLPNRAQLLRRLQRCLDRSRQDPSHRFAVLFLDIDNFKLVNDSLGHDSGDRLLVEVARRLGEGLRDMDDLVRLEGDAASRLGGDEFVVVLDGLRADTDAAVVAERLMAAIRRPIDLEVQQVALSASIGIALGEPRYVAPDEVLRDADTAMYRAKSDRSGFAVFDPAMHAAARQRLSVETDLRRALDAGHLSLALQPIVDATGGSIVALEALVRWDHPDYPARTPADFLPVAEETGLVVPLGEWLLGEAATFLARLRRESPAARDLRVDVNVSRRQLLDPRLPATLRRILEASQLPPDRLVLEITESTLVGDVPSAVARLRELKDVGVGLHLDDFGTGYSSLACLKLFPLDVVKIDPTFISTLGTAPESRAIVSAIVTLAHQLGMTVTVEGVETEEQMDVARETGSDFAQGYHIHRPQSPDAIRALFREPAPTRAPR